MYKHANVYFSNYSNFILVVTPQLASDLCVHIIPKTISKQFNKHIYNVNWELDLVVLHVKHKTFWDENKSNFEAY